MPHDGGVGYSDTYGWRLVVVEAKKKRGSYSVGLATREAILNVASEMIAEVGYHAMSLRDLARRVGISHPAVIYHFPNKEAMIRMIMQRYEDALGVVEVERDECDGSLIPRRLLVDSAEDFALALMRLAIHPEVEKFLAVTSVIEREAGSPDHPLHDYVLRRNEMVQDFMIAAVRAGRESGHLRFMTSDRFVAHTLLMLWSGMKQSSRTLWSDGAEADRVIVFLATCVIHLQVTPETLLAFSGALPEELATVYVRVMAYVNTFLG